MTIDERLEVKIHIDNDREYRQRFQQLTEAQEKNARDIQSLTGDIHSLTGVVQVLSIDMQSVKNLMQMDAENRRALARIAELHAQRLDRLEEQ